MRWIDRLIDDLWMAIEIAWYSLPYMGLMAISYGGVWAWCLDQRWLALVAFLMGAILFGCCLGREDT